MMSDGDLIDKLQETFKDAARQQRETLGAILEFNGGVSYLQPYLRGYDAPVDAATFRRAVPLSCYDDYADSIGKLADGVLIDDEGLPLLSVDPLLCFFYSSGTNSMRPKLVPCFDSKPGRAASSFAHQCSTAILRSLFPPRSSSNKVLGFIYAGNVTQTSGGFKAMPATAFPLHITKTNAAQFLSTYITPEEVISGSDAHQQMYCHMLCGLRHYELIDGVSAPYAAGLIKAFTLLESHWEKLCEDLATGIPDSEVSDAEMRKSMIDVLRVPNPELSYRVRRICEETSWRGIVSKLWPNARYIRCVTTGSMEQYYPKLCFYSGEKIPIVGGDYFASECPVAINLDKIRSPDLTRYVLLPTAAYFEFLPFDLKTLKVRDEEGVGLSGVKVGEMYELVVTTYRGMYRLRLGDIVKVVGFHYTSPEIEFVMRAPKGSGQAVTEKDLLSAMASFQLMLRDACSAEIIEFSSFMDMESEQKQLKVFVEVKDVAVGLLQNYEFVTSVDVRRKCYLVLEDCLGNLYQIMRGRGDIGPVSVSIVRPGSFDWLLKEAIRNGAPASQYKPPKIIVNSKVVDYLEKSVVLTL